MAYEYYCSFCGKRLSQETVLFDMQRLLIEDKSTTFNVLKFRLTERELRTLIAGGEPGEEGGLRKCSLTLEQVMGFVGNKNNLKDPLITGLTMEMINDFTAEPLVAAAPVTVSSSCGKWEDDDEDEAEADEAPAEEKSEPEEKPLPLPIQALLEKVTAMVADASANNILKSDLEILKDLFEKGAYTILIKEYTEEDDDGKPLLTGYQVRYPLTGVNVIERCRVCPKCGKEVFEHAGEAKHRSVVFIGNPASGKTSTILALTHYARHHLAHDLGSPIWTGAENLSSVRDIELIGAREDLREHLSLYEKGIAPERTLADAREKAYSATFWITSQNGKHYILTLTDLPGEICNKDGKNQVDETAVLNDFQVALGCDAFIVCFDTQPPEEEDRKNADAADVIDTVCAQADTFQKLRMRESQQPYYIPTMLLFTKCEDLEGKSPVMPKEQRWQPLDRVYMLRGEKQVISNNGVYSAVCSAFGLRGDLKKAYHAMLRCSPFGYGAPSEKDVKEKKNDPHKPTPKNIDHLMNWLLMVSGCIPVDGRYCPTLKDDGGGLRTANYYLKDTQYRAKWPEDEWGAMEALARLTLFENPGVLDRAIVEDYGQSKAVIWAHKKYHQLSHTRNDD